VIDKITFPAELFTRCDEGRWQPHVRNDIYVEPRHIVVEKPVYHVVKKNIVVERPVYRTKEKVIWLKKPKYKRKRPSKKSQKPVSRKVPPPLVREPKKSLSAQGVEVLLDEQYGKRKP
jgi:hypothetical protein